MNMGVGIAIGVGVGVGVAFGGMFAARKNERGKPPDPPSS
jgi:hypothetical protein